MECPRTEERHAVFPRLQAGPCRWFRVVILASIPASVAGACEASPEAAATSADSLAEDATSVGPPVEVAISAEVAAVVADTSAAEEEATDDGKESGQAKDGFELLIQGLPENAPDPKSWIQEVFDTLWPDAPSS